MRIEFPAYKFAVRERLVQALLDVDAKVRDYDYTSRKILRPCERFTYRLRIPKRLKAVPLEPEILLDGQPFPEEQQYVLREPRVFNVGEEERDGEVYWTVTLDRIAPPHHVTYRLRWRLPRRGELRS